MAMMDPWATAEPPAVAAPPCNGCIFYRRISGIELCAHPDVVVPVPSFFDGGDPVDGYRPTSLARSSEDYCGPEGALRAMTGDPPVAPHRPRRRFRRIVVA